MSDTEKITINMNIVDLGQVDLLIEQGFYSNRTDFIKTAIRNQLSNQSVEIKEVIKRKNFAIGVISYGKKQLEEYLDKGIMVDVTVVGLVCFQDDIPIDLVLKTINSIKVHGSLRMSDELKGVLKDRIV